MAPRPPPPPTLAVIAFSHFCEVARWALDIAGVAYREVRVLPLFHGPLLLCLRRRGASRAAAPAADLRRVSSPLSTPALLLPDGLLQESSAIVRFAAGASPAGAALLPGGERGARVDALCKEFHDALGPAVRTVCYHYLLEDGRSYARLGCRNVGAAQAFFWVLLWPLIARGLRAALSINAASAARAETTLRALFADASARLADGRAYFVGDAFTAADLTFAALAAPLVGGACNTGVWTPAPEDFPAPLAALALELRATRAGAHVGACYKAHRGARRGA
jgi:glutathione S-transferase